ncbi:hypothetical protein [Thiothrix nivea]|uniref:Uncharacterized protein n=1 Tax=Thiothrix nivea (strain ATCC 35100 / DSM 5205 / JP2) TaxID=870187 RepID=A0A656HPK8_THINJ|nr:hypothetical protein [Thiothrix nivea]EIJ36995.1 hypothetical protein Thini_4524 [Thiothrix nivea DSM 5205]
MDLSKIIEDKVRYFKGATSESALKNIILHIKIAEKHYANAKEEPDHIYLYTDAIYRTNQAFEGALKEAYKIISKKDGEKLKAHQLEEYFLTNDIVTKRISKLLKNYREEWRNLSTHDYNLSFAEEEAFLAIVNISAFFAILLDKMIKDTAYEEEKKTLDSLENVEIIDIENGLLEAIEEKIGLFFDLYCDKFEHHNSNYFASELAGIFLANIEDNTKFEVSSEVNLSSDTNCNVDFLVTDKNNEEDKLIIEIKISKSIVDDDIDSWREKILNCLTDNNIKSGIIFIPPHNKDSVMEVKKYEHNIKDEHYNISIIYPSTKSNTNNLTLQQSGIYKSNYYWLNSNKTFAVDDSWQKMIDNKIGCTYGPLSYGQKLYHISKGDRVFLYVNSRGIVASGEVTSLFSGEENNPPLTIPEDLEMSEYSIGVNWDVKLNINNALTPPEIREVGHHMFRPTFFKLNSDTGKSIQEMLVKRIDGDKI